MDGSKLTPSNPLVSFDARDWARAFMEHNAINPDIARDEETMVTWFANALMRGYDEHANRQLAARTLTTAPRTLTLEQAMLMFRAAQYMSQAAFIEHIRALGIEVSEG